MLISYFYTINSQEVTDDTTWTVNLELNPRHGIYQGHFPGNPILPGVCTLQIIKECAAKFLTHDLQYAQINSCKYLSVINPEVNPQLQLYLSVKPLEDNQIQLLVDGKAGETDFIKLKATLSIQ